MSEKRRITKKATKKKGRLTRIRRLFLMPVQIRGHPTGVNAHHAQVRVLFGNLISHLQCGGFRDRVGAHIGPWRDMRQGGCRVEDD